MEKENLDLITNCCHGMFTLMQRRCSTKSLQLLKSVISNQKLLITLYFDCQTALDLFVTVVLNSFIKPLIPSSGRFYLKG